MRDKGPKAVKKMGILMNWHALYCRSNTEKILATTLEAAGVETYYPHTVIRAKDPKARKTQREREVKYFPGYLFAKFDLGLRLQLFVGDDPLPVQHLPQVVRMIGWENRPIAIPDSDIDAIRAMVAASLVQKVQLQPAPYVVEGDRVTVIRGPFAGLEGFVLYSKSRQTARVVVSIHAIAQSVSTVELGIEDLKLIPPATLLKAA
jgi:transcription antitermination factor NusG